MAKKIKNFFKKFRISRITVLGLFFIILSFILIQRLFHLQIIEGQNYANNFILRTTKERPLKSSRGMIYDRNGNILAKNELSYSLTLEDNGTYPNLRTKHLALNGEALAICRLLETYGSSLSLDFHIYLDDQSNYQFDVSGTALERFRADVFGKRKIEDLEKDQLNASANDIIEFLSSPKKFTLYRTDKPYKEEELNEVGLPEKLTKKETLQIVSIRYALSQTSFAKYKPITLAKELSEEAVAALTESKDKLQGIEIEEDSKRVYEDSVYFASILGYTGKASAEELAELQDDNPDMDYSSNSVIGKAGIEQVLETTLQGKNGSETVYVDNLGKVLQINEKTKKAPVVGNNVYLTIDKELQIATYKILEQKIAGILVMNTINEKEFDKTKVNSADQIRIPIYDIYNALIGNSIIDIELFKAENASEIQKKVYNKFLTKQGQVLETIKNQLTGGESIPYKQLKPEVQEYISYIINDLLITNKKILDQTLINKKDETYLAWIEDGSISIQEYLMYAASQNWIDISSITTDDAYLDSTEVYNLLTEYISNYLEKDKTFSKLIYKHLIKQDIVSGNELCHILYEQGILDVNDSVYEDFSTGKISPFDLLMIKIKSLEITPAQLALDPCSGSAVVTDPQTGEVLACVSYPGYDNNKLAQFDSQYYNKLFEDLSKPFYNKATQERTAPGSTFKLVTSVAGLSEGVINTHTEFTCAGVFNLTETPLYCWNIHGHGNLSIVPAIQNSCNVFFNEVAYNMGLDEEGKFSDSQALNKLAKYAQLFNLDAKSGIEIPEAVPNVSDFSAIPSSIGQGTHNYTTSQLARYVSTLANGGTSYDISLIDKVTNSEGALIKDYTPGVKSQLTLSNDTWDSVHKGMRAVIENNKLFKEFPMEVSGKTGTAQQSNLRPNHGVFIGYAPSNDPSMAVAVRIAFGYSSTNAVAVAKDIISYKFNLSDESEILTGKAAVDEISNAQTD